MDSVQLAEKLRSLNAEAVVTEGKQFVEIQIPPSGLYSLARQLKENEDTGFDFLFCLSGVDYGHDLGVVYHLRSTKYGHSVVLKSRTSDRVDPQLDSVADIWRTAEFHEREVFDLLGIKFTNHPDLRRFFLPSSAGFPLRKDFVDDINIVTKK
ncbi:MAG: NADH-quinone oxidoreductase subunit C [Bacteroidales bacterium]|nr:NADH-quinone oxidoreductase subunit C [Bacteroidales bacterium]